MDGKLEPTWNRRDFVKAAAAFTALNSLATGRAWADGPGSPPPAGKVLGRMAFAPATWYRPYVSKAVPAEDTTAWVQVDLGADVAIEEILLYPASWMGGGYGFPQRYRLEGADDPGFAAPRLLVDQTAQDSENPNDQILQFSLAGAKARYVRLTATKLRKGLNLHDDVPTEPDLGYVLALSKLAVLSGGADRAEHAPVTADDRTGHPADFAQLTRSPRPMGEGMLNDRPEDVLAEGLWRPVANRASLVPAGGVTLGPGLFRQTMEKNIAYLLGSFSVAEMLRPFRQRAGLPVPDGLRPPVPFWDTGLPGSSAGRFLMGAGNTLRWIDDPELRRWMDEIVDGIEACRQPNGYIMAYPEDTIFESERGAYTRSWLTHGLLEAGYAGNAKAFALLRGYYDWYNTCPYLPKLLRGALQGVQGMVANSRVFFSPVGRPADLQVLQRYFQEDYWLAGLAKRDPQMIWQYPYDRPHNYLITVLEAYLDLYRGTGDQKYLDAVLGGWDLYRDNWEHVGGSIAITEWGEFPPKSYRLQQQFPFCETGETCGSVFWVRLNQRFALLEPGRERYVAEIEKSIYNVGLANQVDGRNGILYHTRLVGRKGDINTASCTNSCCEGQGTRLYGSLPEYVFALDGDGAYVNLFEPSTLRWTQAGTGIALTVAGTFPSDPAVRLEVEPVRPTRAVIRIRVPGWAAAAMAIQVNGAEAATGQPGTYAALDRTWAPGDRVTFTLPMDFRVTPYRGLDQIPGHERVALEYGPILLALVGSDNAAVRVPGGTTPADFLRLLQPVAERPLHFRIAGHPDYLYLPYWKVREQAFTCYPVVDLG